jgi:HPt (histidine-containing phosphotransfer) domain-containing protein
MEQNLSDWSVMDGTTENRPSERLDSVSMEQVIRGIDPVIRPLIPMFLEHSLIRIQGLDEALNKADVSTIKKLAHTMKGSSSSYGFNAMAIVARDIEDVVRKENPELSHLTHLVADLYALHEAAQAVVVGRPELFQDS